MLRSHKQISDRARDWPVEISTSESDNVYPPGGLLRQVTLGLLGLERMVASKLPGVAAVMVYSFVPGTTTQALGEGGVSKGMLGEGDSPTGGLGDGLAIGERDGELAGEGEGKAPGIYSREFTPSVRLDPEHPTLRPIPPATTHVVTVAVFCGGSDMVPEYELPYRSIRLANCTLIGSVRSFMSCWPG